MRTTPKERNGRVSFIGLLLANTILGSAMPMLIIMGGLAGILLAPSPILATLPPSIQMLAGLAATAPFSLLMGRFGRRFGFMVGGMLAATGGGIGLAALFWGNFLLLCLAHVCLGAALACYLYFRFAAAEVVPSRWQPVGISLMLTSGLVAAFVGPEVFTTTKDFFAPVPLAGAYGAIAILSLIGLLPLAVVKMEKSDAGAGRNYRLMERLRGLGRPAILTAVLMGAVSQGTMTLLMVPTPLAMTAAGHGEWMAGDVVRWHVVAMFAPSFFTGFLIKRLGTVPVVTTGLLLLIASAVLAASGLMPHHFYGSLILLGLGWNFGYIGATNQLASVVSESERAGVQGANDTLIALASTICAFASGAVVTSFGWHVLALSALPVLFLTLAMVLITGRRRAAVAG